MDSRQQKSYYQAPKSRGGVSWVAFFIVIITTIVVSFIVYQNVDNIKELFGGGDDIVAQENLLVVWDEITLEGYMAADGDIRTYSHTLQHPEYGYVGLKSREIDLNEYAEWNVTIQGVVDRLQWSTYVIEVSDIEGIKAEVEEEVDADLGKTNSGQYVAQAGLFFPERFFQQYEIVNASIVWEVSIKNIGSNQDIKIKYFKCDTSDNAKNCDQLAKTFSNAGEKSFKTVNGVVFYKLYEVKSWFARGAYHGYYINDVNEAEVASLAQYIQVVNDELVNDTVKPYVPRLCRKDGQSLETITSTDMEMQGEEIILSVEWTSKDGEMTCELSLNPNLVLGASTINVTYTEVEKAETETGDLMDEDADEEMTEDEEDGILDLDDLNYREQEDEEEAAEAVEEDDDTKETVSFEDYDGEQFPINLEKTLTFESRRGHKIIFPSSNISFAGVNVSTDLGEDGVNCFSQMNVVKYGTEEEERDANPSVRIFECNIKDGFAGSNKFRHIEVGDDRHFIVETVDPAWQQFAEHVEVE